MRSKGESWSVLCNIIKKRLKRETKYIQLNGGQSTKLIYEVIEPDFFNESDIFPDGFIKKFKGNATEDINTPIEVKNNINRMAI